MITTLKAIVNTACTDVGNKDYPATYKITDQTHVHLYYTDTDEVEVELVQVTSFTGGDTNEYKITLITETGFLVTIRDGYADGNLSIRREVPLTQEVDYPPGNDFPAATHERALDKMTAILQEFKEKITRQIGMPLSEDSTDMTLPAFISNYYLGLNGDDELIWKVGTVAIGNDEIKDSHIDWGTASEQVSAVDMPIADAGGKITATEVEGALQENRIALDVVEADLITTNNALDVEEAALVTHKSNNGSDHSFIDQDVKVASGPTFNGGLTLNNTTLLTSTPIRGAQSVAAGAFFVFPRGIWMVTFPTGVEIQMNTSTWYIYAERGAFDSAQQGCVVISDGTNMRLLNNNGASIDFQYHRF